MEQPLIKETIYDELFPHEKDILEVIQNTTLTLAEISRISLLPRSTAEYNLKKLLDKNLLHKKRNGKRIKYLSKYKLKRIAIPHSIVKAGPVTIYIGVEAIESLWKEMSSMPKKSRLIGIQPRKSFSEAIRKSLKTTVKNVSQEITDRKFIVDAIVHQDMARGVFETFKRSEAVSIAKAFTGRLEDIVKVSPPFLDEKAEWFSIGNKLVFIDWYKEFAIKIDDSNIDSLIKSMYNVVKEYGVRYNQGEYIESLIEKKK